MRTKLVFPIQAIKTHSTVLEQPAGQSSTMNTREYPSNESANHSLHKIKMANLKVPLIAVLKRIIFTQMRNAL